MRYLLAFPAAAMLVCSAAAGSASRSVDAEIAAKLKPGEQVEARIDADFNGDGESDAAWIAAGPDRRTVHVHFVLRKGADLRHVPAGSFALPSDRLGPADLSVNKDVLVIKDLTGGTTALAATYRFRGEAAAARMRLIGLDARLYSRTFAHEGARMSWNLLTGDLITARLELTGSGDDAAYREAGTKRVRRPIAVIDMESTPDAEAELAAMLPSTGQFQQVSSAAKRE
ncbi:hypothetical protein [Sphingopyxis flava]|uniref:Uncharacterized protein n=1 Tax=Sphingopyxis flava TaxID=1507287 RepID=A0A1T4ZUG3_9SPHN|nr:hypothetical protein [Sphingopyxis flava]SKB26424.1 hypothetical protein SAMN06295937_1001191 [Sphingopyxis flava]